MMAWLGLALRELLSRGEGTAFTASVIDRWWQQPFELHPPVGKYIFGLTWALSRSFLGDIEGFRLGNALIFGLLVALVYIFATRCYGRQAGLFAAAALTLMPHVYGNASVAALDIQLTWWWTALLILFWEVADRRGWGWDVLLGLGLGLAFATKFNAVLIPFALGLWALIYRRSWRLIVRLAIMVLLMMPVFVTVWPWLYPDVPGRFLLYLGVVFGKARYMGGEFEHAQRVQYYLGRLWPRSPWHYPFVMTAAVTPLLTLLTALLGLGTILWRRLQRPADGLIALGFLVPLAVAATPISPVYGGVRHILYAYPFLAVLAGLGFARVVHVLTSRLRRNHAALSASISVTVAAILLLPALGGLVTIHPYLLEYYSETVGGVAGAARLGLEATYWADSYRAVLPYLNEYAPAGATVWAISPLVMRTYQQAGLLRSDLIIRGGDMVDPRSCDLAVVQNEPSGFIPAVEDLLTRKAAFEFDLYGVPLAWVFDNKDK